MRTAPPSSARPRRRASWLVLPLLLSCAACGETRERLTLLDRQPPAELVQPCPPEPPAPPDEASDNEFALWVADLRDARKVCDRRHRALSDWAVKPAAVATP